MDDARRVALIETKTVDASARPFAPTPRIRYQLDNHLGSAVLELDDGGHVISYEEYHPYGTTAYHAATGDIEVSTKRYRYTSKERDEETGLYYHGARYYASWLGRWTSADPAGLVDGPNLYRYVRGNPVRSKDPSGMWDEPVVSAPAPGLKKTEPPPPGGKDYASSKAIEETRQAAAAADRVGAELGGKFGKAIGDAQEALETLNSLTAGALPRILKSNPDFVDELQSGLATKLNAIPELPTYSDPKLAEIARKGFERGFGSGLADAKLKAAAVRLASEAALALSGNAAVLVERAGATALKGALARLKDIPIFIPGTIDGGGAFFRLPKPQIAQAARGAGGIAANELGAAREATVAKLTGGKVTAGEDVVLKGVGKTDIDVVGPNGELIMVGGPAKAGDFGALGRVAKIYKGVAAERGVPAQAYLTNDTPQEVFEFLEQRLGKGNVFRFNPGK
jgi:RHS repeat-associated protein